MTVPARMTRARPDDEELVRRVRAGDDAAFAEVVARYQGKLVAFARRVLGAQRDQAEDVVQEAFVRALRALRRDDRPMHLSGWLYTLVRNCCLDELARRHQTSVTLDAPTLDATAAVSASAEAVAELRAGVRGMLEGIAALPHEQRHALVRHEVDGASHRDIAAELGITPQASRSLVFRARQALTAVETELEASSRCEAARADVLRAHQAGRRASHRTHRHLAGCAACRAYRARVRSLRRALHALHPGVVVLVAAAGAKAVVAAGKATGVIAGGTTKTAAGAAGTLAAVGAVAVGGTLVIGAGEPSPMRIESAAVPGGVVRAGSPLPEGTAIVTRDVALRGGRADVRLACPAGHVVVDLLPPDDAGTSAVYDRVTVPGASGEALVRISGPPTRAEAGPPARGADVGVAVLCRRPDRTGAVVPPDAGRAFAASGGTIGSVCVRHTLLRVAPHGRPRGSVVLGEPVTVLGRRGAWRHVRTQFGARGWLRADATCG
jgi:RNA polymerase sigma factor (sigma-70 family)